MRSTINTIIVWTWAVLFSFVVAGTCPAGDDKYKTKEKKVAIWTEKHRVDTDIWTSEQTRPDGQGIIDRINEDEHEIVIDDSLKYLSNSVKYLKENGYPASASVFKRGELVAYKIGPDKEIIRLYHLDNNAEKGK